MSLVLGVIVDTFGQLRQDRKAKEDDRASKCFICSLDSYRFLNVDGQFNRHIKKDHNMWDYVYFTMYLENTTVAQRNHHEIYLFRELMEKQSIKPFPVLRAMALKEDVDEKDVALLELTKTCATLRDRTEDIAQKMEQMEQVLYLAELSKEDDTNNDTRHAKKKQQQAQWRVTQRQEEDADEVEDEDEDEEEGEEHAAEGN